MSTIDYFIISEGLLGYVEKCDIEPGYKTDHSMISIDLITVKNDRHRGFWKLNMAHLTEIEYVNMINKIIKIWSKEMIMRNPV